MSDSNRVINFMGIRNFATGLSILLLVASVISLATRGLNFGLDFTGGSLVEVEYSEPVPLGDIRNQLAAAGYQQAVVVYFGADTDVLVRLPESDNPRLGEQVASVLRAGSAAEVELRRVEYVGPQVGEDLREMGGLAVLLALGMVLIYISMRFQFKFALGAVTALAHDVLLTLGVFSITGWDFDLTVLAALLAVIGYSLNDTIVVSDRIRENFRKLRKQDSIQVINVALTETLERTILTGVTTLMVLVALAVIGGEMIFGFSIALIVGIVVGTYSSIYIAADIMVRMGLSKEDLMPPEKEGATVDDLP